MITVFTPTYNRRELLKRCYNSLEKQTNKKFIWLIIDDGSVDNTKGCIDSIKEKASFGIEYYYQQNGGKHRAHNNAVKQCKSEYFLILDSDDILDEKCIETLYKKIELIKDKDNISGIIGNRFELDKKDVIGSTMPDGKYLSGIELYQKYRFYGDTLRLYKTNILKDFLFPEVENEKFMYENVIFDKIDSKYKMYTIGDKLYYCEYQDDGYTKNANKLKIKNPIGYSMSLKSSAETAVRFNKKINYTILYIIWCRKMKIHGFKNFKSKLMYVILFPITLIFDIIKFPRFFYNIFKEEV